MKKYQVATSISVERLWGAGLSPFKWYVVETHHYKIPKWQFWRNDHTPATARIYGGFPSRNKAEQFAKILSNPL